MQFGFSYVGVLFLVMLLVPNLIWSKHKPVDYDKYVGNENRILRGLEDGCSVSNLLRIDFCGF